MKKWHTKPLALLLAIAMLSSLIVLPVSAAEYRTGAQSGPSSSYKNGRYYKNYLRVPITGENRTDLIAMALSQLGYQEGNANGAFSGEVAGSSNYVEYSYNMGDLGLGYGGSDYPWCACFVSWCLYQSHCTDQATHKDLGRNHIGDYKYIWKEISCSQWVRQLKGAGHYKYSAYEGGTYTPKAGDLVFFQNSKGVAHIGICLYTKNGRIYTVEGNTSDSSGLETNGGGVYFKNYLLTTSYINGYGVLPYKNNVLPDIDYSGANPTPGLYVANASKYIYSSETDTSYDYIMSRFTMFEVTEVCGNGRLKGIFTERGGSTVTGYISNNSDRVIQLSATETDGTDEARTELEKVVETATQIRHYDYSEETIQEIREIYTTAVSVLNNSASTQAQLTSAADALNKVLAKTGSNTIALNNQGIYINGRNSQIGAGDCFIFSPSWNGGLITVDNANIRYTINVVGTWDEERQINVVKSISYGTGNSTPSIQLESTDFLIACHDWETGIADSDSPVEYSGTNYRILSQLSVGDAIRLSGATALNANTDVSPAAYLKFIPKNAALITGENVRVGNGCTVLFTPDFNGGLLTHSNANVHNTLNVLVRWDNVQSAWIVADKFAGNGTADETSNIEITDGQVLIACHVGDTTSMNRNWNMLYAAQVGQKVLFSGISPTDGADRLSISANVSFVDVAADEEPEEEGIVNLALGKDVDAAAPGTALHTADLTDGAYIDALDFTGGWYGFASAGSNMNTDANGIGCATIDLGETYALDSYRVHLYAGTNEASISQPSYIDVAVSNNGVDFVNVGTMVQNFEASASYWAELSNPGVSGRYVRLTIGPSNNATWVFLNEIEVCGSALTGSENVALATTVVTPSADGYDGNLVNGELDDWYAIDTSAGSGSVVVDLGSRYQITSANAFVYAGETASSPTSISVSISPDGVNYAKAGEMVVTADAAEPYWACLSEDAMVGRYVKLDVTSQDELVLISEVKVFGIGYVQSADNNIALGKDYTVSNYPGSPFTASLTDGVASQLFQYNVNNSSWFGFYHSGDASTSNVGISNNRGIVTLDLGGQAEITGISNHVIAGTNDAGAIQPNYINVYYSKDGVTYDYACTMEKKTDASEAYWVNADFSSAPLYARYVKFAYGVNAGELVLLNEIKVNGLMLTSDEVAEPGTMSTVALTGSFNDWNVTPNMRTVDAETVTTTLALDASSYEFKILYGNQWYGNNGTIQDTTVTSAATGWVMEPGANNCVLNASRSGNYRFTFNLTTMALVVEFVPDTLYLRGTFNQNGTDTPMVDNGSGFYSVSLTLEPGTHKFVIAEDDYGCQWPEVAETVVLDNTALVTVTLNIYTGEITVSQETVTYTVTFVDYDGSVLSIQAVAPGSGAKAPVEPTREGYIFAGWDVSFDVVNENLTVTAQYTAETVEPELFDIAMTSMTMGNSLAMNVAFEKGNVEDWTGHYAVITKTYADGRENVVETVALADWKSANIGGVAHYYVTFNGIAAKEMTDDIHVEIFNADGDAVSNVYTDSVAAQSARILAKSITSDEEKTMIVDMLNYGAAAQEYFGYGTDNLANAGLTEEQAAYASAPKTCTDIRVKGTNYVATNVVLKSNIQMMFAFQNIDTTMTAKVTFTNHRGVAKEVTINGADFTKNGNFYVVTVDALVVADGRQAVSCVVYDANGNEVANATDSLESYTARKNGTEDIFVKMMQYSDSAYAYFH